MKIGFMNKLNELLDTRTKRVCMFSLILYSLFCVISALHLFLGVVVVNANTYDQILGLLDSNVVRLAFLGRIAVCLVSMAASGIMERVLSIVGSCYLYEWILLGLTIIVLFSRVTHRLEKNLKRMTVLNSMVALLLILLLAIIAMVSMNAGSLSAAFSIVQGLGYGLILVNGFLLVVNGYALCQIFVIEYPKAMGVTEIETVDMN